MDVRKITGVFMIVLGVILSLSLIGAIYGIPILILGIIILLNKKEDEIEQIKSKKGGIKK
jgi:hypothetical protein